jgi:hypothetical protein
VQDRGERRSAGDRQSLQHGWPVYPNCHKANSYRRNQERSRRIAAAQQREQYWHLFSDVPGDIQVLPCDGSNLLTNYAVRTFHG